MAEGNKSGAIPLGPMFACLYNYFSFLCNFVLLETICVKLAMDMWGWDEEKAIANMGWIMMGAGVCTIVVFLFIGPLSKRYFFKAVLQSTSRLIVLLITPMRRL